MEREFWSPFILLLYNLSNLAYSSQTKARHYSNHFTRANESLFYFISEALFRSFLNIHVNCRIMSSHLGSEQRFNISCSILCFQFGITRYYEAAQRILSFNGYRVLYNLAIRQYFGLLVFRAISTKREIVSQHTPRTSFLSELLTDSNSVQDKTNTYSSSFEVLDSTVL